MNRFLILFIVALTGSSFIQDVFSQVKKKTTAKTTLTSKTSVPVKKPVIAMVIPKQKVIPAHPVAKKTLPVVKTRPAPETKPQVQFVKPAGVVTLTAREKQMIDEINLLRTNPSAYSGYITQFLQKTDADAETKNAAKELTSLLKTLKPLPPLSLNPDMYNDARQYGLLMSKKNIFEHSSLPYNENLSLGYHEIRDAIIDLLIDSDIPTRGHRKNLLAENIKYVAVFELPGKINDIPYCYVQEFK